MTVSDDGRTQALENARRIGPGGRGPMLSRWTESTPALIHALSKHRDEVNRALNHVQVGGAVGGDFVSTFCDVRTLDVATRRERAERDGEIASGP